MHKVYWTIFCGICIWPKLYCYSSDVDEWVMFQRSRWPGFGSGVIGDCHQLRVDLRLHGPGIDRIRAARLEDASTRHLSLIIRTSSVSLVSSRNLIFVFQPISKSQLHQTLGGCSMTNVESLFDTAITCLLSYFCMYLGIATTLLWNSYFGTSKKLIIILIIYMTEHFIDKCLFGTNSVISTILVITF